MRMIAPLAALLLALTSPMAAAQDAAAPRQAEPIDGRIDEHFDRTGSANVSGGLVVGALLGGSAAGLFPPDQVWIATPSEPVVLCLQVLTRDGFYSARTRYRPTGATDGMEGTLLMPFTHVADDLRRYRDDAVAIIATAADDQGRCRSGEARLFPRVPPDLMPGETTLLLQVNAAGRSAAWVETEDGRREDCPMVEADLAIGFDRICQLQVPVGPVATRLGFTLWVDDGLRPEPALYLLAIPGHEGPR